MHQFTPLLHLIAQEPPPQGNPGNSGIFLMVIMFAVFWFFLIAPQRRRQKETEAMLSRVKRGDRVIFSGGIYGTVTSVKDEKSENEKTPKSAVVTVEVANGVRMEVRREAISHVLGDE